LYSHSKNSTAQEDQAFDKAVESVVEPAGWILAAIPVDYPQNAVALAELAVLHQRVIMSC
jgi:hypothetical protein